MGRIWSSVSRPVKRRLAFATLLAVGVPPIVGELVKQFNPSTFRAAQIVDFIVIGSIVFGLTMVFTALLGCLLVGTMKGPVHLGDDFPAARER